MKETKQKSPLPVITEEDR